MEKIIVIAIMGEAGSGKDYLLHFLQNHNKEVFHTIVSETTRPPRDYEINGKDYNFRTEQEFTNMVFNGEMLEATSFNGWYYGTSFNSLDKNKINIGIFNPQGVEAITLNPYLKVYTIHVLADDKTRLIRQLNREENPNVEEIIRRWSADKHDFAAPIDCKNNTIISFYNGFKGQVEDPLELYNQLEQLFDFGQIC